MRGARWPTHMIRVTAQMKEDIDLWLSFLQDFNGISFWRDRLLIEAELQVCSDATGGMGFGVYFWGRWCAEPWPDNWKLDGITSDLTFLKLLPIVVAVHMWVPEFINSSVRFWCDNLAIVHIINS